MRIAPVGMFLVALMTGAPPSSAAMLGQTDRFDSPSRAGWRAGQAQLSHEATGGPGGPSDGYVRLEQPAKYHLAMFNATQWVGDYLGAGITAIEVDINVVFADQPLGMRIVLFGPGGAFSSRDATPIFSGWRHYTFGLTGSDLVPLSGSGRDWPGLGSGSLADTLAAVTRLQLRNDPTPAPTPIGLHPLHVTAKIGVDNIRAIPEPTAIGLLGAFTLLSRRRSNVQPGRLVT